MLITTSRLSEGTSAKYEGDKIVTFHAQEVSQLLRDNYKLRNSRGNGFTDKRTMRHVMEIDNLGYLNMLRDYPDLVDPRTGIMSKTVLQRVKKDPRYQPYFTVSKGF